MKDNKYEIYDCLYGRQELTEKEYSLILTPEIQRLRYIRLSNIDSISLTGCSNISRFEHSVGTFVLAKQWLQNNNVENFYKECITYSALFHDICSAPFGHSFQYILEDNIKNETSFQHQNSKEIRDSKFYQKIEQLQGFYGKKFELANILPKDYLDEIDAYINGEGKYGELISSEIDFDNIDNVIRMAFHMGILQENDRFIPINLVYNMKYISNKLCFTKKAIPYLNRWYEIRKELYNLLLTKWSDFSAKAMLTYAIECTYDNGSIDIGQWNLTDNDLLKLLYSETGDNQTVSRIAERLYLGDLYSPLCIIKSSSFDLYESISKIKTKRDIEDRIKEKYNINCIFHPILDKNKTNRILNIHLDDGETIIIGEKENCILLGFFVKTNISEKQKQEINNEIILILHNFGFQNLKNILETEEIGSLFDDF